jgi:hypothetical protein
MINKGKKMKAEECFELDMHSVCLGDLEKFENNDCFRRQGAIDIFNYDKCEFLILEKI